MTDNLYKKWNAESYEKEIAALREQVAAEKLANIILVKASEEWERRAEEMHYWMQTGTCNHKFHESFWAEFVHNREEAAEWFPDA